MDQYPTIKCYLDYFSMKLKVFLLSLKTIQVLWFFFLSLYPSETNQNKDCFVFFQNLFLFAIDFSKAQVLLCFWICFVGLSYVFYRCFGRVGDECLLRGS